MNIDIQNFRLETKRCLLVPVSMKYKEDIFKEFNPEVIIYMCPPAPKEMNETENFIKESLINMKEGKELSLSIFNKETDGFLGGCGIHKINTPNPEFGIWLKKSAHGNGLGKEVIKDLYNWMVNNIDFDYITYPVDKDNTASKKLPESIGGITDSKIRKDKTSDGRILNLIEYKIYKNKQSTFIRQYNSEDPKGVWDLHCKALYSTGLEIKHGEWENDLHNIESYYLNNKGEFLIAEIDGNIVGIGALRKIDNEIGEIKRMRTDPNYQKQGIGTKILERLLDRAKELGYKKLILDFTPGSIMPLKSFYGKYGFKKYKQGQLGGHFTEYYEKIL